MYISKLSNVRDFTSDFSWGFHMTLKSQLKLSKCLYNLLVFVTALSENQIPEIQIEQAGIKYERIACEQMLNTLC